MKWAHYFDIYEQNFGHFCRGNASLSMAEIGIQSGGSLLMWRHAFGKKLQVLVGMDTNPNTKSWEKLGENIKVEVGSQADPIFLQGVREKYPQGFDILIDDGSHIPNHQFITFSQMWQCIRPGGVYLIEDLHGQNPVLHWLLHGHSSNESTLPQVTLPGIYYSSEAIGAGSRFDADGGDLMNRFLKPPFEASKIQNEVESIRVYPFVVAITRRKSPLLQLSSLERGTQWIPYGSR